MENLESLIEELRDELKWQTNALQAQIYDIRTELARVEEKISELSWRVSVLEEVD